MPEIKSSKVKIFVGCAKQTLHVHSDVFQPILTAPVKLENQPNVIRDDTGVNIASRNRHYAELSGHYWVWKNFLPETDAEYVGFCHYRRFLDFNFTEMPDIPFLPTHVSKFVKMAENYTEKKIYNCIKDYDVILPEKIFCETSIYNQYLQYHPQKDMDLALKIIDEIYPEYTDTALKFMSSNGMYNCLNFIMKKSLVNEYLDWIFNILTTLERRSDWKDYVDYSDIRVPAFIAERFINIWLLHNIKTKNLKVLNTTSIILYSNDTGVSEVNELIEEYIEILPELKKIYEQSEM